MQFAREAKGFFFFQQVIRLNEINRKGSLDLHVLMSNLQRTVKESGRKPHACVSNNNLTPPRQKEI